MITEDKDFEVSLHVQRIEDGAFKDDYFLDFEPTSSCFVCDPECTVFPAGSLFNAYSICEDSLYEAAMDALKDCDEAHIHIHVMQAYEFETPNKNEYIDTAIFRR